MITRYRHNNIVWIDLESPTSEEVREIMEEYSIHPSVAEELLLPSLKPRVEVYDGAHIYLILHFPASKHTHSLTQNQEVDFVLGKNFLITARYDTIDSLHKFSKLFEVNTILEKDNKEKHAGDIFFEMVRKLYSSIEHEIEYVNDTLIEIEKGIFEGLEKEMVHELSEVSRDLLNFKQALTEHQDILRSLESVAKHFFEDDFTNQFHSIVREYHRIQNAIATKIDSVVELRETNNSLITTKQNEIMKILTIMAFVTFPLSLFASIFGMNTETLPLTGFQGDFWYILSIMVAATVFFFIFFKHKKWL